MLGLDISAILLAGRSGLVLTAGCAPSIQDTSIVHSILSGGVYTYLDFI